MSPTYIPDPRPLARQLQRPPRTVELEPRRPGATAVRTFATPVVHELPPRREQCIVAGTW